MGESLRDLLVWQRAIAAIVKVYQLTSTFPADERFGLTAQLRRAAVSVASNIAEGYGAQRLANIFSSLDMPAGQVPRLRLNS